VLCPALLKFAREFRVTCFFQRHVTDGLRLLRSDKISFQLRKLLVDYAVRLLQLPFVVLEVRETTLHNLNDGLDVLSFVL